MDNEANIVRVSFEEIQEFHKLDLFNIVAKPDGSVLLLTYDPATRLFSVAEVNLDTGVINLIQQSVLATDITAVTDDLSVESGFVFKKGKTLTEVVQLLANPIFNAKATLTGTNSASGKSFTENILMEIATPSQIVLQYEYEKRQGGDLVLGSESYYIDNAGISNTITITSNIIEESEFKVTMESEGNASFDASTITDTIALKVVYPVIFGTSETKIKPNDFTGGEVELADIEKEGSVLLPIAGQTTPTYFWFALQTSLVPINWIGIYSNGNPQYSNEGLVNSNFSNMGTVVHKGHNYNVFMTTNKTIFEQNIKINF